MEFKIIIESSISELH